MSASQLPFDSDAESILSPEPQKKKGSKPAVKRQAPAQKGKRRVCWQTKRVDAVLSSESESEVEEAAPQPKKRGRKPAVKKQPSGPGKKKKLLDEELSSGDESEAEGDTAKRVKSAILDESEEEKTKAIVVPKLQNLLWRKVASGYTSQRDFSRKGEFYIDFRISYARDAESKDGYKKTLVSYKSCVDKATEVYEAAEKLVAAAKKDYKNITPVLYPKNE